MSDKICIKRLKRVVKSRDDIYKENFESWVGYWRSNIHRFITDYLGLLLYDFQKCLIWMFEQSAYNIFIASRGLKLSIYL